jgi:hypothetical protein
MTHVARKIDPRVKRGSRNIETMVCGSGRLLKNSPRSFRDAAMSAFTRVFDALERALSARPGMTARSFSAAC